MDILEFAELDGAEAFIEFGAPGAGFFAEVVALAGGGVVDAFDGADDSCGAASASLFEFGEFFHGDGATFDLHAHILSELDEALVGDRREDGSGLRGDVGVVFDAEEVGSASLVDKFLLFSVEIELASILAAVACLGVSLEGSGVVAADLIDAGAEGSGAVVVAGDDVGIGLEAALEIRADGSDEDEEEVFVSRFDADGDASTDEERTEIERSARAIGRDEAFVEFDYLDAHFAEAFGAKFRHHDAAASALEAGGVFFEAEDTDFAVFAAEGLEALESLLPIVKGGSSHVDVDAFFGGDLYLAPVTVAMPAANIVVRFEIAKRKVLPIYIHDS